MNLNTHTIYFGSSANMKELQDESVHLVVTSPPYPMIEMWDDIFAAQSPQVKTALAQNRGDHAFEGMHLILDKVWEECFRVLKSGGFMCINIGDATRTINKSFKLYNNHSRIVKKCEELGLINLPNIIWRKVTNAPNKFMGSGMLPCGAYVTLEHEYILIFRKGDKRAYKSTFEKQERMNSSFFWEERNIWFSDIWDFKGVRQTITNTSSRERNASYPLEIPYRLINMYSQQRDVVLDPFMGLGTTAISAIMTERSSVGYEIDAKLGQLIIDNIRSVKVNDINTFINSRITRHKQFIEERIAMGKEVKHLNENLDMKVITKQESEIILHFLHSIRLKENNPIVFATEFFQESCLARPITLF